MHISTYSKIEFITTYLYKQLLHFIFIQAYCWNGMPCLLKLNTVHLINSHFNNLFRHEGGCRQVAGFVADTSMSKLLSSPIFNGEASSESWFAKRLQNRTPSSYIETINFNKTFSMNQRCNHAKDGEFKRNSFDPLSADLTTESRETKVLKVPGVWVSESIHNWKDL